MTNPYRELPSIDRLLSDERVVGLTARFGHDAVVDLVATLSKTVTVEQVNNAFKEAAAKKPLAGILEYSADPLVSMDVVRNPASALFDAQSTMVMQGNMVKVVAWYDSEWGYSNRVIDLLTDVVKKGI